MKNDTRSWAATSTTWKEASRIPRKPFLLGFFIVMVAMTSAVTMNAQALTVDKAMFQKNSPDMAVHAPTVRQAKTSMKETVFMLVDFVRQTNRRNIS